jgi:hypothetical protein
LAATSLRHGRAAARSRRDTCWASMAVRPNPYAAILRTASCRPAGIVPACRRADCGVSSWVGSRRNGSAALRTPPTTGHTGHAAEHSSHSSGPTAGSTADTRPSGRGSWSRVGNHRPPIVHAVQTIDALSPPTSSTTNSGWQLRFCRTPNRCGRSRAAPSGRGPPQGRRCRADLSTEAIRLTRVNGRSARVTADVRSRQRRGSPSSPQRHRPTAGGRCATRAHQRGWL